MSSLAALRKYATEDPCTLPASVLLTYTKNSVTIFDAFPKSNSFHLLLLPRIVPPFTSADLSNLGTLLRGDRVLARTCLENLARDAENVKAIIRKEMVTRYGFEWPIFTGFHAVQSMEHVHLHIIASDFFAPTMKNKKHYNSFNPKAGFFLHIQDVLEWFDAAQEHYESMSRLSKSKYEPLLKQDLACWQCDTPFKTIPQLKEHLRGEWESRVTKVQARKRKRQLSNPDDSDNEQPATKVVEVTTTRDDSSIS